VDELGGLDEAFVKTHTREYPVFLSSIRDLSWDAVTAACGVARAEIEAAAQMYCRSEQAVFAWGMGMTHHLHGVRNIEWISNLALMRGMVGRRGAGLLPLRGHSNVQGIGTMGVKPVLTEEVLQRIQAEFGVRLPDEKGMDTLASLEAAWAGRIDVALMMGGNLFEASPDTAWTETALDRIGTKIYLTTTLNRGHVHGIDAGEVIILPVCARDEEPEPTTQESMFNYVRLSDGGIERIASARSETSVLVDLGQRMLTDLPFDFGAFRGHQRIRQAIAKVVPGMAQLKDIDVAKREFHVAGRLLHTPTFRTPSGKAAFVSTLPEREGARRHFTLMSVRSEGQFNSIIYEAQDSYRGRADRWVVHMNQQDALELGAFEGAQVDISSEQGVMAGVKVRVASLPPGCGACYYPEANVLTGRRVDPRSHTPAFKSVPVDIRRRETRF